ncbi:MAG: hypothetical protein AABN95_00100 [Acidobacteriota bacterium]
MNRVVQKERFWVNKLGKLRQPRLLTAAATVGVFSYSLYLTHELVIMQSWRFTIHWLPPMLNTLLITTPATILFAWLFYRFCEKPYLRKATPKEKRAEEIKPLFAQTSAALPDEA